MSYNEVELYGRKIRVYSDNHIEMEMRGKKDNWQIKPCSMLKEYKRFYFNSNGKQRNILLHRLIFYSRNPSWDIYDTSKDNSIDHQNGDPSDNSIENLRCVTHQENGFNRTTAKGYSFDKRYNKWQAKIRLNGKDIGLGMYAKETDARDAYLEAKSKYHIIEERVFD